MKITIYELLGLIKDDKAPKKIKYNDNIYYSSEDRVDLHNYQTDGSNTERKLSLIIDNEYLDLNDYVEIIEEPKKIEKITVREKTLGFPNGEWTARNMDKAFAIKINELIDEINNLKEND